MTTSPGPTSPPGGFWSCLLHQLGCKQPVVLFWYHLGLFLAQWPLFSLTLSSFNHGGAERWLARPPGCYPLPFSSHFLWTFPVTFHPLHGHLFPASCYCGFTQETRRRGGESVESFCVPWWTMSDAFLEANRAAAQIFPAAVVNWKNAASLFIPWRFQLWNWFSLHRKKKNGFAEWDSMKSVNWMSFTLAR